jgi:16S rRNA processing protein RimM
MLNKEVKRIAVGVVRRPHGINGGVKVTLYNIDLVSLQNMEQLFVRAGNDWKALRIKSLQGRDEDAIIHFAEIKDRTEAENYRREYLYLDKDNLPELDEKEFFIDDLLGCLVFDEKDTLLGAVEDILSPGAHEVLVVRGDADEVLIPMVEEWVSKIDVESGKIYVRSIEEIS